MKPEYDNLDRVVGMEYKGSEEEEYEKSYGYEYGANGLVGRTTDIEGNSYVRYDYDHGQRTTQITGGNLNDDGSDGTVNYRLSYDYDEKNNLSKRTYEAGPRSRYVSYEYNEQNRIDKIGMTSDAEFTYSYDSLGRAISRQNKPLGSSSTAIINESYSYLKGANNSATSLIERIGTTGIKKEDEAGNLVNTDLSYKYDYDANGNITKIYQTVNGEDILRQSYEYDAQNQLTRENNAVLNKTVIYRYTSGGNILSKIEYPYTTASEITSEPTNTISYAYGDPNWKDKLTAYNGQSIAYDEIGNPLTYGDLSFTWEKGRRLSSITDGENTYSYTYNADGIRTSKTVNGVRIDYVLEGDMIVYQKYSTGEEIWYNYDASGKLLGFHRRTADGLTGNYYYIRNGQGDILGFHNQSGRVVVRYTYDAWGKLISISGSMAGTLGKMNPFRYRGYYYDEETELYYLNSRYYSPDWGRFVNSDNIVGGTDLTNLYSYCANNPVNRFDPSGHFWKEIGNFFKNTWNNAKNWYINNFSGNCYSHALKKPLDPRTGKIYTSKLQPGELSGQAITAKEVNQPPAGFKATVERKVKADCKVIGYKTFNKIETDNIKDYQTKDGNWVVALVYGSGDYHWYRREDYFAQDGNYVWSQKGGGHMVSTTGADGLPIVDPSNPSSRHEDYDCFVGYYEIGPN